MNEKIRNRFQTVEEFDQALNKADEAPENVILQVIETPQIEKIEVNKDDTIIEKEPEKAEKTPKSSPAPEPPELIKPTKSPNFHIKNYIIIAVSIVILIILGITMLNKKHGIDNITSENEQKLQQAIRDSITLVEAQKQQKITNDSIAKADAQKRQKIINDSIAKADVQKKQQAANLVQQANSTYTNNSLGATRYEQAFQLYKKAKDLGGDVSSGYRNFLSRAKLLIENGSGYDANVKIMLQYAQQLSNTQEVRELLDKCK